MKNLKLNIFLLLLSTSIAISSNAQIKAPKEVNDEMSEGNNRGWKQFVPEATGKAVESAFRKLIKTYGGKVEKVKKSADFVSRAVNIPSLGESPVDVYFQIQPATDGAGITSYVKVNDRYLSSEFHPSESKSWSAELKKFARNLTIETIANQQKAEEKKLTKLNKELKGLDKDKLGYEADIKDAEEKIVQRKKDITQNQTDQENKKSSIQEQKALIEKIKSKLKQY